MNTSNDQSISHLHSVLTTEMSTPFVRILVPPSPSGGVTSY